MPRRPPNEAAALSTMMEIKDKTAALTDRHAGQQRTATQMRCRIQSEEAEMLGGREDEGKEL